MRVLSEKSILASFLYVVALLFFFQNGLTCYSIPSVIHSVESNVTSGIDTFAVFIRENIMEIGENEEEFQLKRIFNLTIISIKV